MSEPSLDRPPVYWQFSAGGTERLRLSRSAISVLVGCALLAALARTAATPGHVQPSLPTLLAALAIDLAMALLIAALAARWLGDRIGVLAGFAQITSAGLMGHVPLCGLLVAAAMGAFCLANVPGRLPAWRGRWLPVAFFACLGCLFFPDEPAGPTIVLTACGLYLLMNQDRVGLRFLLHPAGLAMFGLMLTVRLIVAGPAPRVEFSIAQAMSWDLWRTLIVAVAPWSPLILGTMVRGLHHGHLATPVWRFLSCWLLVGLAAGATGMGAAPLPWAAVLPPLAVMAGVGLADLGRWNRRIARYAHAVSRSYLDWLNNSATARSISRGLSGSPPPKVAYNRP